MAIKALIICNGKIRDYEYYKQYTENAELVICADGGANHAARMGIIPDVILGDFDSVSPEIRKCYCDSGCDKVIEFREFPSEKDMTDSELALDTAVEKGADRIVFIGCLGNRIDHTIANINLLKAALDRGIDAVLVDEYNEIRLIKNYIEIEKREGWKLSLLPLTPVVSGITTSGLYYPLSDATMEIGPTRGISNEFTENKASVRIRDGLLLVILSRDES